MRRARLVVLACLAGCGVRAPAAIDVEALLRARGPVEARRELVVRTAADPRDIAALLALAALDERLERPSDAIAELELVVALGGPAGVRWHDEDKARLARLITERGWARLYRGAASALADLERARSLGAAISDAVIRRARITAAIVAMRHSEAVVRDGGRRVLLEEALRREETTAGADGSAGTGAGQSSRAPIAAGAGSAGAGAQSAGGAGTRAGQSSPAPIAAGDGSAGAGAQSAGGAGTGAGQSSRAPIAAGAGSAGAGAQSAGSAGTGAAQSSRAPIAAGAGSAGVAASQSAGEAPAAGAGSASSSTSRAAPPGAVITDEERSAWLGARAGASAAERGRFGVWLWKVGARRAAWDELSAWRAVTQPPRDVALDDAYLVAARWWTPLDLPGPSAEQLRGPMRCAFVACPPREVVGDAVAERAYLLAPLAPPVRDPADAAAVAIITLRQALRGEVSWGAAIAARVDLAAFAVAAQRTALPAFARPVITRLAGRDARPVVPSTGAQVVDATEDQRLVIAATRALDGAAPDEVTAALDGLSTQAATALRMLIEPLAVFTGDARAEAAMRYSKRLVPAAVNVDALRAIAAAFARDPAISDRLARDAVAVATDAAVMHAGIGAVFDALGDPARARAAWQAAVDASPEPAFLRGLACAQARQGDGPAALVLATSAAAASGDPAVVWTAVARALVGAGRHVAALEAARSAIDLAGPETLAPALDAAIAASRALDRDAQADRLTAQRARIAPINGRLGDRDPTDARAALDAHRAGATPATLAALWTASRWNPRDVELRAALLAALTDAPRRASITTELVELAGDRDPEVGRAAVAALR